MSNNDFGSWSPGFSSGFGPQGWVSNTQLLPNTSDYSMARMAYRRRTDEEITRSIRASYGYKKLNYWER